MNVVTLSLSTTEGLTPWIAVPRGASVATITIVTDEDTYTFAETITLQWSSRIGQDERGREQALATAFSPTIQFTSSAKARRGIPVSNVPYIRLATTTATGSGDPQARAMVDFH